MAPTSRTSPTSRWARTSTEPDFGRDTRSTGYPGRSGSCNRHKGRRNVDEVHHRPRDLDQRPRQTGRHRGQSTRLWSEAVELEYVAPVGREGSSDVRVPEVVLGATDEELPGGAGPDRLDHLGLAEQWCQPDGVVGTLGGEAARHRSVRLAHHHHATVDALGRGRQVTSDPGDALLDREPLRFPPDVLDDPAGGHQRVAGVGEQRCRGRVSRARKHDSRTDGLADRLPTIGEDTGRGTAHPFTPRK